MMNAELDENGALEAFTLCFGFVPCMVAKAVCELGVPSIMAAHHHHQPISAFHIAQSLSPPPTMPLHEAAEQLDRIMRCLSAYNVFQAHANTSPDHPHLPATYSLTPVSKWLAAFQPLLQLEMSPQLQAPWHHLSQSLLHGSAPFTAAHSLDLWDLGASDPSFGRLFQSGASSVSHFSLVALLQHYDGLQNGITTLVDVGGGTGTAASSIAARYPHVKVINFDLPSVIHTAPSYQGVEHIGGDMLESVPPGDAIFMKWVLHDWNDEDCIKILKNCHKALPRHGKLIIMEAVLDFEDSPFHAIRFALDMVMVAHTTRGKERTKNEWEVVLRAANFSLQRIIDLPCPQCLIEAIPL